MPDFVLVLAGGMMRRAFNRKERDALLMLAGVMRVAFAGYR